MHIFNKTIRAAKIHKGITAIQLDISKAFDTMPHAAISPALRRLGAPSEIISSICSAYQQVSTTITHKGSKVHIKLKRGVKQVDPLSPFLFNAVMDPLLEQLEMLKGFHIDEKNTISSLAFADDLLMANTHEKAQTLLTHTEKYLESLRMRTAADKCASIEIRKIKDS